MSDAHSAPVGEEQRFTADTAHQHLSILHATIVNDDTPDPRYMLKRSNKQKIVAICKVTGEAREKFHITEGGPFDSWLKSLDRDRLTAGLYLSDLRVQFFGELAKKVKDRDDVIDGFLATSEWWYDKFSDVIATLNTGQPAAKKVLH